ncbi:hypothetical protein LR48_Vigan323s000100 [Vigna angularis]|uniref:Uncharacterized protein n=1 Tax=Phaseolus angularis TaxID=3914 RepID=A0A0L9T8D1_PHAAN|nr:hypothetical protein LR48_Vigan323s000100 [Vigna angularis]
MVEAEDDPLSKLMTRLPRLKRAPLELYWDLRVFGLPPHVLVYITLLDALEVIGGDRMLNISIIQLWCMYMDTIVVDQGQSSMYEFVEPQTIQPSDDWNERFKSTSPIQIHSNPLKSSPPNHLPQIPSKEHTLSDLKRNGMCWYEMGILTILRRITDTRLMICKGHNGTKTSNGDVMIFPDMVLVKDRKWLPRTPKALKGSFVFVYSNGSHDRKCGVYGSVLVNRFKEEVHDL